MGYCNLEPAQAEEIWDFGLLYMPTQTLTSTATPRRKKAQETEEEEETEKW